MEGQGISNIYTGSNKIRIRHRSRKEVEKIKRLNTKFSKPLTKFGIIINDINYDNLENTGGRRIGWRNL